MELLIALVLACGVTMDNLVIGQATSLPIARVAVLSTAVHLVAFAGGTSIAPLLATEFPHIAHWLSPCLFLGLAGFSIWSGRASAKHSEIGSFTGAFAVTLVLASDAFFVGATPAAQMAPEIMALGILVLSPLFVGGGRVLARTNLGRVNIEVAEAALFFMVAIYALTKAV